VESAKVRGVAGRVHDIGVMTLPKTGGIVAGVVVDASGTPVGGVRIFNEGDGPMPLTTSTGADGRFRLEGFFAGPVYVFARKQGYRFTGVRTRSDETNLRVTLSRPMPRTRPGSQSLRPPITSRRGKN
jgi:hypothetical protein